MRLRQTFKELTGNRWHIVWEDKDSRASFVYVGERLNPAEARERLGRLLQTETWSAGQVHWVWKRLEGMG